MRASLDPGMLALAARLTARPGRASAARALARHLGAEDLIVFVPDPELGVLLPALGFPQTLPEGGRWRAFLAACLDTRDHDDELPSPVTGVPQRAHGIAGTDGSVLILLAYTDRPLDVASLAPLIALLAASFGSERAAQDAGGHAAVARDAAAQARLLAETLDAARREVQRALAAAQRAQERTTVLAAARDLALAEAQEALNARGAFVASVTHDLKTPLTTIRGVAQLLQRRARRGEAISPERLEEMAGTIETAAVRTTALVDQLLDIAQLQAGEQLRLERAPTDLVQLAGKVVRQQRWRDDRHIVVHSTAPTLIGEWDTARIERVVANLVDNAIRYSPAGGEIAVRVGEESDGDGRWAVLAVEDHGIGIPSGERDRVFDRYHRGGNVVGKIAGTGIGLASVRQIVTEHGGTIALESVEDVGTTFTIRLPLAPTTEPS